MLTNSFLFVVIFHIIIPVHCYSHKPYSIVQTTSKEYYLLIHKILLYRKLADVETANELLLSDQTIIQIESDKIDKSYREGSQVPSLKRKNTSPDEKMRVLIQKIRALYDPTFWKLSYCFPNRLNPSVERWKNRTLMIWRPNLYDSNITVSWLADDLSRIDSHSIYHGIGFPVLFKMRVFKFNNMREDPRLLAMNDGSLIVSYTSKESLFEPPKQCFFVGTLNQSNGNIEFNDTILLESKDSRITQKNWIPFEYNGRLLFIQSIEPLHVVENIGFDPLSQRGHLRTVVKLSNKHTNQTRFFTHGSSNSIASIWRAEYGLPIRGGTPAILVRGIYLAFFHTVSKFQLPTDLRTYFMGAITFCPHPPFNVHSISPHPIVNESMYTGKWTDSPKIDYVVFPIGIMLDPVDPDNYVWVSFGHQDIEGWLAKFELDGLLDSLEMVSPCANEHIAKKRKPFDPHIYV